MVSVQRREARRRMCGLKKANVNEAPRTESSSSRDAICRDVLRIGSPLCVRVRLFILNLLAQSHLADCSFKPRFRDELVMADRRVLG